MSFKNMFWSTLVKCKQLDDNKIRATIPDTTSLWNPIFPPDEQGDPAPYLFTKVKGDFQVWVKVSGKFKYASDQAGILIRENNKVFLRCGLEVSQKTWDILGGDTGMTPTYENCISTAIINHQDRDTTNVPIRMLTDKIDGGAIGETAAYWFSVKRRGNVMVAYCSDDGEHYKPIRMAHVTSEEKVFVGVYGACPVGKGLKVVFTDFEIKEGRPDTEDVERPEQDELQESIHYPHGQNVTQMTSKSLLDDGDDDSVWDSDFADEQDEFEKHFSDDDSEYYYRKSK